MCTTFVLINKNTSILGKSYDFYYGHGLVLVNKRNLVKSSLLSKAEHKIAEWKSKYGSITFNQFGRELPQCGINEAGFAVAQMNLLDVKIAEPHKKAVNELQWIQYQLDNYSSVKEAVEHAKDLSIELAYLPLHYTICDTQGNSAIIEFMGDEVRVYENPAIAVLTNNTFEESLNYCQKFDGKPLPESMYPLDRFVRTYYSVERFNEQATKDPIAYAFSTLDNVKSTLNFSSLFNYLLRHIPPGASYWNVIFDCKSKAVYFRTLKATNIKHFSLGSFDYSCSTPVRVLDVNSKLEGDVSSYFHDYQKKENVEIINKSYAPVKDKFPPELINRIIEYPETCRCTE